MFRRHAPEFVQDLQNTTQQVDGAVAEYERRQRRLANLREEALGVVADLAEQIEANRQAATTTGYEQEAALDKQAGVRIASRGAAIAVRRSAARVGATRSRQEQGGRHAGPTPQPAGRAQGPAESGRGASAGGGQVTPTYPQ